MLGWGWVPRWEPLIADFVTLGRKLEQFGFVYYNGKVSLIEPEVGQKDV
jgi:hypothetical protein